MYTFTDAIQAGGNETLPAEAVRIDGQYIENAISGYQTLYTKGRESLAAEINSFVTGSSNGETVKGARYPSRTITVGFRLIAETNADFRSKLNHLNNLLSAEDADFVFNDESDKFYTGTPIADFEFSPGRNKVVGEWHIFCADPFKYSIAPIKVSPSQVAGNVATFAINYLGSYPAKPVLRAKFAGALSGGDHSEDGDCGFVAFVDSDENIIQLGNPDAVNLDAYTMAAQLINRDFTTVAGWAQSGGHTYKNKQITGSVSPGDISDTYWNKGTGQTMAFAKPSYGSGGAWHGPILWKSTGDGAVNFDINIVHRMCAYASGEIGTFECGAYHNSTMVAGIVIEKAGNGTAGTVNYIVNGVVKKTQTIDLSYYNANFGYCKRTAVYQTQYYNKKKKKWQNKKIKKAKTRKVNTGYGYTQSNLNTVIKKSGATVSFKVGNLAEVILMDTAIENTSAENMSFHFGANGTLPTLHTNAVRSVRFTRNPSAAFADTPNVFTAGDIVEADTGDASVYIMREGAVEGQIEPQYGALGNNWESFMLTKGTNAMEAIWSEWVREGYEPTVEIEYNEVYI